MMLTFRISEASLPPTRPETLRHHLPRREPQTNPWGSRIFRSGNPICIMRGRNLTGQKFGRLTVVRLAPKGNQSYLRWSCRCECGNEKASLSRDLLKGSVQSCGCLHDELKTRHGDARNTGRPPGYVAWTKMKSRILNPSDPKYPSYGGRGITLDERWHDFVSFITDMGRRPTPGHSIDRIDNDKGYYLENCRWATRSEQQRNRRNTRWITYKGETKCIAEWVLITGLPFTSIFTRIAQGYTPEEALELPRRAKRPERLTLKI